MQYPTSGRSGPGILSGTVKCSPSKHNRAFRDHDAICSLLVTPALRGNSGQAANTLYFVLHSRELVEKPAGDASSLENQRRGQKCRRVKARGK